MACARNERIKAQVEGGHYTNDSEYIRDLDIQLRGFRRCGECLTTNRVMSGARPITNSSRTDCRASTNGRSTCGVELAMMAIESRPPGLVARYAADNVADQSQAIQRHVALRAES